MRALLPAALRVACVAWMADLRVAQDVAALVAELDEALARAR